MIYAKKAISIKGPSDLKKLTNERTTVSPSSLFAVFQKQSAEKSGSFHVIFFPAHAVTKYWRYPPYNQRFPYLIHQVNAPQEKFA